MNLNVDPFWIEDIGAAFIVKDAGARRYGLCKF
jgi:hypothetical protein